MKVGQKSFPALGHTTIILPIQINDARFTDIVTKQTLFAKRTPYSNRKDFRAQKLSRKNSRRFMCVKYIFSRNV